MKKVIQLILILSLLIVILSGIAGAQIDKHGNLKLKNDYISIIVNKDQSNQGRFAVDITGGAPLREGDNGKPLIYGRPKPWTSYTTLRVDGTNYVFGGPTDKRAGRKGEYGQVLTPPQIKNDQIITKYKYGELVVSQILSFVKSSTTGLPDTAQIKYQVTNQGKKVHQVGLRVMLDTMLGKNDGAPFRIKNQAITDDQLYTKQESPSFWQAFDSLNNPQVTAQGTIKGPNITAPDQIYFADWGSLADGLWDFDFNPGQKFLRKGEFELDSALSLLWQPDSLQPGETREYVTNYGLGGITIVPGLLSLGVTSPAKVIMDRPDKSLQVVAYIQNTAEIEVEDVEVKLKLPSDLELLSNSKVKKLGDLKPQDTAQVMWKVRPDKLKTQKLDYQVEVSAENTDDNQVARSLQVVGPPKLNLKLDTPAQIKVENNHLLKDTVKVYGRISNNGDSTAHGVNTYLALPPGLDLAAGDKAEKYLGSLAPGQSVKVPWQIKPVGLVAGKLPYSIGVDSKNAANQDQNTLLHISNRQPEAKVKLEDKASNLQIGDYLTAQIKLDNISSLYRVNGGLSYNSQVLEPVYISRGDIFVRNNQLLSWNSPQIKQKGLIKGISGTLDTPFDIKKGTIVSIHFKVKSSGQSKLKLTNFKVYNDKEQELKLSLQHNQLTIGGNQDETENN
ncbi:hypothetical protein JCM16358_26490 [Halanaerocella petrolearia]